MGRGLDSVETEAGAGTRHGGHGQSPGDRGSLVITRALAPGLCPVQVRQPLVWLCVSCPVATSHGPQTGALMLPPVALLGRIHSFPGV